MPSFNLEGRDNIVATLPEDAEGPLPVIIWFHGGGEFRGQAQELDLPSAPKQFLHYFEEDNRPQTKLDRNLEHGMAVSIGRLRPDKQYDVKFVCLSHNTLLGAAGGGVLTAELLAVKGYLD